LGLLLGAVALITVVLCVTAPRPAQAYIGQSLVEAGTGALTTGAEKVVQAGKFVPETVVEAGAAGGAAAATEAEGVFAGAGVLPAVITATGGFTAGWEVGTEICEVSGIEGCIHIFGNSASEDPSKTFEASGGFKGRYEWKEIAFVHGLPGGTALPAGYVFFFGTTGSPPWFTGLVSKDGQVCNFPMWPDPPNSDIIGNYGNTLCTSAATGKTIEIAQQWVYRYAMHGLNMGWNATDSPSIPNLSTSSFSGNKKFGEASWLPAQLHASPAGEKVGQKLAHELSPKTVPDPYATTGEVPNCGGLTYAQCAALLEGQGLEPVKNTLGWQTADLGTPADLVTQLAPATGSVVAVKSKVTVTVNPDEAGMPVLVPAPEAHETYDHYVARLPAALVPQRETVPEAQLVPDAGPDAVLDVTPEPETRADPDAETDLEVRTNPSDAPPIGGAGGGGTCSAGIGAVDWSPLNQPLGNRFPFGVFGFFAGWIADWEEGEGHAPEWSVTILPAGVFGRSSDMDINVDLAFMAPVVTVCRTVFLFAAFVGLLWFLGTAAAKLQGDNS